MRFLIVPGVVGGVHTAHAAEPQKEETLIRQICRMGSGTQVAQALRMRGSAAVSAAHVLPNPSLVLQYQATLSRQSDDREAIIGLELPLQINGRRGLLQDAAESRRAQANAEASVAQFEAALAFREDYVEALATQAEADVLGAQQTALEALNGVIQGLARGGEAAGYDLMRQQTQVDLHRRSLEIAYVRATGFRFRLAARLGHEVILPVDALRALLDGSRETVAVLAPSVAPHIQSLTASARASSLEAAAARRRSVPDLDLFAGYRSIAVPEGSGHGVALRLGIPLTFFDHGQGEAATADAEHAVAQAFADRLRMASGIEVKTLQLLLSQYVIGVERAAQASAQALASQATAQKLYAAGEATLTDLYEAFRSAEQARIEELRLALEIAHTRLALMRSTGTLLDPMLDRACGGEKPGVSP